MKFSPIALFVYNRLTHTKKVINSLKKNKETKNTEIFIFSDGPRSNADKNEIIKLRKFILSVTFFKKIYLITRKKNIGLSKNIISGLDYVLKKKKTVIVLEDDLVVSPNFLKFMNTYLEQFEKKIEVCSICAYNYPIDINEKIYFLRGSHCWGWATWRRYWFLFEKNPKKILKQLKKRNLNFSFNMNNHYPYTKMLEDNILKKNDSWAVRWHASMFLNNYFTLYPQKSMVKNIGFDGTGEHCSFSTSYNTRISKNFHKLNTKFQILESKEAKKKIIDFFKKERNLFNRIKNKIITLLS